MTVAPIRCPVARASVREGAIRLAAGEARRRASGDC